MLDALRSRLPESWRRFVPAKMPWSPTTVPVVRLTGVIAAREGAINLDRFAPLLDRGFAQAKQGQKLLLLAIESPGGSPVQSDLIGAYIRRKAAETDVRVIAVIGDVGASGGYWIACAADQIFANRMSIVGSIGVIGGGFGAVDLLRRIGVERRVVTAGANKLRNDPFSPERPDDVAFNRDLLDDIHTQFKDWVRERRGASIENHEDAVFDGSYMLGSKALRLGLIDALGDVRSIIHAEAGKDAKPAFIGPRRKFSLARLLGGAGSAMLNTIEAEAWHGRAPK
ncbi:serine protease [Acidiphilium sp. MT5]